jgi:4-amino-4-deoxy-L-arabinose transferase-like glycosyltransferase
VALLAAIVYGLGPVWWFLRLDATPDYWTVFCPACS